MLLGRSRGIIRIVTSERFSLAGGKRFSTNNRPATEPNQNGEKGDRSFTHHDSYRDLEKLDFITAAKILFTTPPVIMQFD
ncbi:hypothetical protein Hanom_Chr03g00211071 [Helianthus anomalus]